MYIIAAPQRYMGFHRILDSRSRGRCLSSGAPGNGMVSLGVCLGLSRAARIGKSLTRSGVVAMAFPSTSQVKTFLPSHLASVHAVREQIVPLILRDSIPIFQDAWLSPHFLRFPFCPIDHAVQRVRYRPAAISRLHPLRILLVRLDEIWETMDSVHLLNTTSSWLNRAAVQWIARAAN